VNDHATPENADALLACPFCGITPTEANVIEGTTFRWRVVVCDCGVVGPEARKNTMDHSAEAEQAGCRAAIKEWNTRAAQPAPEYREPTLEDASRIADIARRLMRNDATYSDMFAALRAGGFVVRETK
jgi:hypothetical protein